MAVRRSRGRWSGRVLVLVGLCALLTAALLPVSSASAAPSPVTPFGSATALVSAQFRDFHGREATTSERTGYAGPLNSGTAEAPSVIWSIASVSGGADRTSAVTRLYLAYFTRNPDVGGLDYWVTKMRTGKTLQVISSNFAGSSEFKNRYGSLSNRAFVDLVYDNVLGRPGDAGGVSYWTKQLDSKKKNRGQVMAGFSESSEYIRKTQAKVDVIVIEAAMVRRIPTGTAWTEALALVTAEGRTALIEQILGTAGYAARYPVPAAPTSLTGTIDDGSVSLTWKAGAANGTLSGYQVNITKAGGATTTKSLTGSATKTVVTGLTNGSSYTFTVQAINQNGLGPASAAAGPYVPAKPATWTGYQGNPAHDGRQVSGSLPASPTQKWSKTFDDALSYPLIARGRVFVIVRGSSASGGYGARLYALDQKTGNVLWGPAAIGGSYYKAAFTWEGGKVFVINGSGTMLAFNEANGTTAWIKKLPNQYSFGGPPVARGGVVYVQGDGSGTTLYAVDQATGAVKWSKPGGDGQGAPIVTSIAVYVSSGCSVIAYSLTGAHLWTSEDTCNGISSATGAFSGDRLFIRPGAGGGNVTLNAFNGNALNTFAGDTVPAFTGTRGYVTDGGGLTAFETGTGLPAWSQAMLDQDITMAPVIIGNRVFVAGAEGRVEAFDTSTGASVWHGQAGAATNEPDEWNYSAPLAGMGIGDNLLIVPADDTLVAFG